MSRCGVPVSLPYQGYLMTDVRRPLILAHRGARSTHIENTIPAFHAGIDAGADGIELDIHACSTGEIVVIHDGDLNKNLGGSGKPVNETPWSELSQVELQAKHLPGQTARVPLLDELITDERMKRAIAGGFHLSIEVKDRTIPRRVAEWVLEHNLGPQSVIYSFNMGDLVEVMRVSTNLRTNFLFGEKREENLAVALDADVWSLNPEIADADADYVARVRASGIECSIGNSNGEQEMRKALSLGGWCVHTDHAVDGVRMCEEVFGG
jgi:glycerophosphoryl diester phosphodiesterase